MFQPMQYRHSFFFNQKIKKKAQGWKCRAWSENRMETGPHRPQHYVVWCCHFSGWFPLSFSLTHSDMFCSFCPTFSIWLFFSVCDRHLLLISDWLCECGRRTTVSVIDHVLSVWSLAVQGNAKWTFPLWHFSVLWDKPLKITRSCHPF